MDPNTLGSTRSGQLETLTLAASFAVGPHPQCVAGTAILIRVAEHFGISLIPRAVALTGQANGMPPLSTGTYSTDFLKSKGAIPNDVPHYDDGDWAESAFRTAGHMIAFDEVESMVLDPSFEQFTRMGMPNTAIAMRVDPSQPTWPIALSDTAFVIYLPAADTGGWRGQYDAAFEAAESMALEIAHHLAAGGSPRRHRVRLDLDGAILR